jgi:hypothetical protein
MIIQINANRALSTYITRKLQALVSTIVLRDADTFVLRDADICLTRRGHFSRKLRTVVHSRTKVFKVARMHHNSPVIIMSLVLRNIGTSRRGRTFWSDPQ